MKKWLGCAALAAVFVAPSAASAGELRLSIANGRVTLVAQDVTVKQILDEWSRVGQTKIVGAERLAGTPVTLELRDVAEGRALESLLRTASGYIAKPRAVSVAAGASAYDAILIMPASRAPAATNLPPAFNTRPMQPQMVMPNIVDDDVDQVPSPIMPPGSVPPPPMPYPGQPPTQQQQQPQQTLPRPGMLPQAPTVPGNPYSNPQVPLRPPTMPGVPGPGGEQNPNRPGGPGGNDA
jgi:hypothetical protein